MLKRIIGETEHSNYTCFALAFFILSIGLGNVITIFGVKLSYISTIIIIACLLHENSYKIPIPKWKHGINRLYKLCILWAVYSLLQVLWVKDFDLWKNFYENLLINILVIFIITSYIDSWDDWKYVCRVFIVLIIIYLSIGTWEINTGKHLVPIDQNVFSFYSHRPIAVYGNVNDYASVLYMGIHLILLYMLSGHRKKMANLLLLLIVFVSITHIVLNDSRGSIYGLVLLAGGFALFRLYILLETVFRFVNKLLLIYLCIGFVVMISILLSDNSADYYLMRYSGSGNYVSDTNRYIVTIDGLSALLDSFFLGIGPGQSVALHNVNLHNFYLEIIVDYGLFVGGMVIIRLFKISFSKISFLSDNANVFARLFPIVLIIVGLSSSKMFIVRPTWICFSLLFSLQFIDEVTFESKKTMNST